MDQGSLRGQQVLCSSREPLRVPPKFSGRTHQPVPSEVLLEVLQILLWPVCGLLLTPCLSSQCSLRGFCYFNSVAIAAKLLQQRLSVSKTLIVDWVRGPECGLGVDWDMGQDWDTGWGVGVAVATGTDR